MQRSINRAGVNRLFSFSDKVKNQLSHFSSLRNLTTAIIAIGIVLRLFQYSLNRSLWLDETTLALNIVDKSFSELLHGLDYAQVAPFGFLFIEKAFLLLLGNNEYVLRLFPLISGIISLFLFYYVARRCIGEEGAVISVGLFSLSSYMIYYASEVKQYSSDALMAVLILLIATYVRSKKFKNKSIVLFVAFGGVAVWFSFTSVFVLAGIGITLSLFSILRKDWSANSKLLITYFIWLLSFGIFYWIYTSNNSDNINLHQSFWEFSFMPFPPTSILDVKWFGKTFFELFKSPLGLSLPGLGALAFLLGSVSMFSKSKELFFILLSPIFVALIVSAFQLYPFKGRVIIFIVPFILLLIGEGVVFFYSNARKYSTVVGVIIIGLLFYGPLTTAASHMIKKTGYAIMPDEDVRSVMKYVKEHKRQEDVLYLYYFSKYPFKYYSERYGFNHDDVIEGINSIRDWNKYIDDIQKLRGNERVWLIFSHTHELKGSGDKAFILNRLNCFGKRLDFFKSVGASVYLYDLS